VFAGRLLQGGYIGVGSAIVPLYIKEFVPQLNGKYGMFHQLLFVFGVVWAFLLSMILHSILGETESYWRIVFGFAMLVAGWQGCMMHWKYDFETPRYLVSDNRNEEAMELLKMIYKP
jgi:MFS family permease